MTTPDTAAVRAWARENGLAVADRGRLPAELHAAYLAAQGGGAPAGSRSGKPAARKAAATTKPVRARAEVPADEPVEQAPPEADEATAARLAALEEQVAALVARVARLEQPAPAKASRFRRRS